MKQWLVMFPGQGSQFVGMGQEFYHRYQLSRLAFEEANEALQYDLTKLIFEGPSDALQDTEVQQPAILVASVAVWRALRHERPDFMPDAAIGLSLGEYSAYVASGAMSYIDAVRLTQLRGRAMQNAVPKGQGGMMAVMGLSPEVVQDICLQASRTAQVDPANYNAPGQIVISGYLRGIEAAAPLIQEAGGKGIALAVSAPFHSSLLRPAGEVLGRELSTLSMSPGHFPVIANVDTEPCTTPEEIKPRLEAQVYRPVNFEQGIRRAMNDGMTHYLELGPGRSLASLVKKINRQATVTSVQDLDSLRKALELV